MTDSVHGASQSLMHRLNLGKPTAYSEHYDASLLQAVPRSINREALPKINPLPFDGVDIWNGYELSWLNAKGKPQVALLRCFVPANSPNLIESKSFKLYLNSFNHTPFEHWQEVEQAITADLSKCADHQVRASLIKLSSLNGSCIERLPGISLDEQDIAIDSYQPNANLLKTSSEIANETLYSDLLKSNCLITNQPDWGSVMIKYEGPKIDHESLLRYIVSFRQHNEFHEQCVERIFCDILNQCKPQKLTVYARYTRRGGLDINPFRSNFETIENDVRLARQ